MPVMQEFPARPATCAAPYWHGCIRTPHDGTDFVERISEHVVQHERCPFGWCQGLEDHLQRVPRHLGKQCIGFRVHRSMLVWHSGFDH
jgi:hypothetical protein